MKTIDALRITLVANLGRCPLCIRASLLGMLAAWSVYIGLRLWWPGRYSVAAALVAAAAFSALALAHVLARMSRTARALQKRSRSGRDKIVADDGVIGRRQFAWEVLRAGVMTGLVILPGRVSALAEGGDERCVPLSYKKGEAAGQWEQTFDVEEGQDIKHAKAKARMLLKEEAVRRCASRTVDCVKRNKQHCVLGPNLYQLATGPEVTLVRGNAYTVKAEFRVVMCTCGN